MLVTKTIKWSEKSANLIVVHCVGARDHVPQAAGASAMATREASIVPANDRTRNVKSWQNGCTKLVPWKRHIRTPTIGVVENKVEPPNTYADADTFHASAEL